MPTVEIKTVQQVPVRFLQAECGVRYWEDTTLNGEQVNEDGEGMPCRKGDTWSPLIDLDTGHIVDWPKGTTLEVHFKVCDDGRYTLLDAQGQKVFTCMGTCRA